MARQRAESRVLAAEVYHGARVGGTGVFEALMEIGNLLVQCCVHRNMDIQCLAKVVVRGVVS